MDGDVSSAAEASRRPRSKQEANGLRTRIALRAPDSEPNAAWRSQAGDLGGSHRSVSIHERLLRTDRKNAQPRAENMSEIHGKTLCRMGMTKAKRVRR